MILTFKYLASGIQFLPDRRLERLLKFTLDKSFSNIKTEKAPTFSPHTLQFWESGPLSTED